MRKVGNLRSTKEELFIVDGFFVPPTKEDRFRSINQTLFFLQSIYRVWPELSEELHDRVSTANDSAVGSIVNGQSKFFRVYCRSHLGLHQGIGFLSTDLMSILSQSSNRYHTSTLWRNDLRSAKRKAVDVIC